MRYTINLRWGHGIITFMKDQPNKKLKRMLIYIETDVQFASLEPLLAHFRNIRMLFDIVVPTDENGVNEEIYDATAESIKKKGFVPERGVTGKVKNKKYQILLSPYIYRWQRDEIRAKYFIQYSYAPYYFNKPSWSINRLLTEEYLADAVLSHAVGTQAAIDVVSKSYITPELRLVNFKKKVKNSGDKPTILFAPTYDDLEFASRILEVIDKLKESYKVVFHGHHRAIHVSGNKKNTKNIQDKMDYVYDSHEYTIKTPLEESDIVISDDSSVFLEAISVGVPVVLFSKDSNAFKYRDINAIQYNLVQRGDVLWTNEPMELPMIIDETLSKSLLDRQKNLSSELFPKEFTDPIGRYMEIINIYLEDKLPSEYYFMKKYWIEKIEGLIDSDRSKDLIIIEKDSEINRLNSELSSHFGIKRSARLLIGNVKRKILKP